MTVISTQIFAILSMVYKIRSGDGDIEKTGLALSYYLDSSEKTVSGNKGIKPDKAEQKMKTIVDYLERFISI